MVGLHRRAAGRGVGHDVLIGALGRPVASRLAVASIAMIALAVAGTRRSHVWPAGLPAPAQVVLALAVWSFVGYWSHRAYHRVEWLWRFHAVHHDVPHMHVFKGNRIHFGEDIPRQFVALVPLFALGVPSWHAIDRELHDANFGGVSPLWDIVFGTFRHPDQHPVAGVGVAGHRCPSSSPPCSGSSSPRPSGQATDAAALTAASASGSMGSPSEGIGEVSRCAAPDSRRVVVRDRG